MNALSTEEIELISEKLALFPEVEEAVLFGSSAENARKNASDIDIAVKKPDITAETILRLKDMLEEQSPLPYFFDVIYYAAITNELLKKQIDENGRVMYRKQKGTKS